MLARSFSKSSKLGFNSTWTKNFQMCKLDLEKAEESEIKLPQHPLDHRKSKRIPEKHSEKKKKSKRIPEILLLHLLLLQPLTAWITANCGKFLRRWEYQNTLHASWRLCMQVKKQQLEPDMEQQTASESGNGARQGCILAPSLFNLYAEYMMWNARVDESQDGIKIVRRNISNLWCADDTTLMA